MADQDIKTLWIGELPYWVDEAFLYGIFAGTGELLAVKIIRSKETGLSDGYGFLDFTTHAAADSILTTYNGQAIPNTDQILKLNWASQGSGKPSADDHSLFVGDLAPEVNDFTLQEAFRQYFPTVRGAKVITDAATGRSKGYGFVRFGSETERDRALGEMNGQIISSRPVRVSLATSKKPAGAATGTASLPGIEYDGDPTNTTLFIGGLASGVTEDVLRSTFSPYGDIVYTKVPPGRGCGFVQFVHRSSAEQSMVQMNGYPLGGSTIRISWGRSSTKKTELGGAAPVAAGAPSYAAGYGYASSYGYAPVDYGAAMGYSAYPAPVQPDPWAAWSAAASAAPASYQAYVPAPVLPPTAVVTTAPQTSSAKAVTELYDPLAPIDVPKRNAQYIAMHQPAMLGYHLHVRS